ncbi:hypothetical protein [Streptomyces sp. NPDC055642]
MLTPRAPAAARRRLLARAGVRRYRLCAVLAPVSALVFYGAELLVLDGLLGSV